jgi:adenylate kinase
VDVWSWYAHALTVLNRYQPPTSSCWSSTACPRTVRQVDLIRDHVDVTCVVHLIAKDREKMVQRLRGRALKEKRFDDAKEEVVRNRLDIYDRETRPVLDRFDQGLVKNVDAVGSPGAVLKAILDVVTPIQEARFGNSLEG